MIEKSQNQDNVDQQQDNQLDAQQEQVIQEQVQQDNPVQKQDEKLNIQQGQVIEGDEAQVQQDNLQTQPIKLAFQQNAINVENIIQQAQTNNPQEIISSKIKEKDLSDAGGIQDDQLNNAFQNPDMNNNQNGGGHGKGEQINKVHVAAGGFGLMGVLKCSFYTAVAAEVLLLGYEVYQSYSKLTEQAPLKKVGLKQILEVGFANFLEDNKFYSGLFAEKLSSSFSYGKAFVLDTYHHYISENNTDSAGNFSDMHVVNTDQQEVHVDNAPGLEEF